ncbi:UNVERIFIED_CONTAM: hypothetical protein FKN15_073698 [Acipenser sinensis]
MGSIRRRGVTCRQALLTFYWLHPKTGTGIGVGGGPLLEIRWKDVLKQRQPNSDSMQQISVRRFSSFNLFTRTRVKELDREEEGEEEEEKEEEERGSGSNTQVLHFHSTVPF